MRSSSKWLIGFGAAIGTLVILAIVLVLALPGSDEIELPPKATPEGVVMRYIMAIQEDDLEAAAEYEAETDPENKITYMTPAYPNRDDYAVKVTINRITKTGDSATVEVTIHTFNTRLDFSNSVSSYDRKLALTDTDDGWKITNSDYIYWYLR